jgi:hypothetical protein
MKQMAWQVTLTGLIIAGGALGCSSTEIKAQKDPRAHFAKYKTYKWMSDEQSRAGQAPLSILDETIRYTVEQQLNAKGMHEAKDSHPGLLLWYFTMTQDTGVFGPASYSWGWGPQYELYPAIEGSLVLRFFDPKTNRTVWQGSVAGIVNDTGLEQEQVAQAVNDLMKKYPS